MPDQFSIKLPSGKSVSARAYPALKLSIGRVLILGHGAGAGHDSTFMISFSEALSERGIDCVTFNFLYMQEGRGAPDRNEQLEACFLAVIDGVRARKSLSNKPVFIGGKSMGGRIASQVAARGAAEIDGLVFLGYPLHPPGKPDQLRAAHLPKIGRPMLFVQGSRDSFGTPDELRPLVNRLGGLAQVFVVEGGDHSFKVPKSAALPQAEVYSTIQDKIVSWMKEQ